MERIEQHHQQTDKLHHSLLSKHTAPPQERAVFRGEKTKLKFYLIEEGDGKKRESVHPEIISDMPDTKVLHEHDPVTIIFSDIDEPEPVTFKDYLDLIRTDYNTYYAAAMARKHEHGIIDHRTILDELHHAIIQKREEQVKRLYARYKQERAQSHNYQRESEAHGEFFCKIINDLEIPGLRADKALSQEDFLDGIDEYIIINPDKLKGEEEKGSGRQSRDEYIGIQRSFINEFLEVRGDHWRTIPERSDIGKAPRVFIKEEFKDYGLDDTGYGTTYTQRLYDIRTARARERNKIPKDLPLPSVIEVLGTTRGRGVDEHFARAATILRNIKRELNEYLESERDQANRTILEHKIGAVQLALDEIERAD